MKTRENILRDAEKLVHEILVNELKQNVTQETIRSVALRVAKAIPAERHIHRKAA